MRSKVVHNILWSELSPEIERILEPVAMMTEDQRAAALTAAGYAVVWDPEVAHHLVRLGARMGRIAPLDNGATWPVRRACLGDGFARYASAEDMNAWTVLRTLLDYGVEGAKQRAEMMQILVRRGRNREEINVIESISRLGGRAAVLSYLEGDR